MNASSFCPRLRAPYGALFFAAAVAFVAPAGAAGTPPAVAVASAHPLATRAGIETLQAGGNAFDAAVAVAAALAVVEPYSSGLGGGGFWLLHRASDGRDVMVDAREAAPLAARRDLFLDAQGKVRAGASVDGPLAAAIPGIPAALEHVALHYGRRSLREDLGPAIRLARQGFEVTPRYRVLAELRREALRASPEAAHIYLKDGAVPPLGHVLRQPDLAATLTAIADNGAQAFYRGVLATSLVQAVRGAGGIWAAQDLARYRVVERPPIRGSYRGVAIVSASPPSAGGTSLAEMLNVLSGWDLGRLEGATRKHVIVEAMRRAYRDRLQYLGDPDFVPVPVELLTHPYYAAGLRASIRLDRATPSAALPNVAAEEGADTTHFSVLDAEGNAVAATLSINYPFGCGFVAPGTGVLLNDHMDDFAAKPGVPNLYGLVGSPANAIAPGKRPLSSMSPTFLDDRGRLAVLGTPGGSRIVTMVLLAVLDFVDGHGPSSWVGEPRFHHQYLPDEVFYEPGAFSPQEVVRLEQMGHHLRALARPYGNMQAILWDRREGVVRAAADPRGEGEALVRELPAVRPEVLRNLELLQNRAS
jgi:gamma-glutamyltranspeptidase/glutathione hydrolase